MLVATEQCGNGARCFVVFVRDQGLTTKSELRVETAGGLIVPRLEADGNVTVDMGVPRFAAPEVPFVGGQSYIGAPVPLRDITVVVLLICLCGPLNSINAEF